MDRAQQLKRYVPIAGILLFITFVAGGFGEAYAPSALAASVKAAAAAHHLGDPGPLGRLGFAAYLIEAVCDVTLTWLLYVILRPVNPDLALLTVIFRVVSTVTFAACELFYAAALIVTGGPSYLSAFSSDQLNGLALLLLKIYGYGGDVFMIFYGIAALIVGYLIFQSRFMPKALGILVALGGAGFIFNNAAVLLAPSYATSFALLPMAVGWLCVGAWFVVKGVDVPQWQAAAAAI